jgi:ATP:guanido phosphotransferase, N-terminal domain
LLAPLACTQSLLAKPTAQASDNTSGVLESILRSVQAIEQDLGLTSSKESAAAPIDPVSNFPILTPAHRSLMAKTLQANPELYTKYCNVKTKGGFTFDQAIQVSCGQTLRCYRTLLPLLQLLGITSFCVKQNACTMCPFLSCKMH